MRLAPVVWALGLTQVIGYGTLYYAYAILAPAVAREFAVGEASLYAIFSAGLLVAGLAAPQLGAWMDRFGAPRLMVLGSGLAALLLAALSVAPSLWVFAALVIAIEIVGIAVLYDAAFATLAQLGRARARRAITHLTLIAGFASTLFWPLTGWLVEAWGWRHCYLLFAALHLLVALPLHGWVARRPRLAEDMPGADATTAEFGPTLQAGAARAAFWMVAISFALGGVLTSALTFHLVSTLQAVGLGAGAYLVAMLMGPAQVAARLADALFWRGLHPVWVAIIAIAALPLAMLALLAPLPVVVASVVFAILLGVNGGLSSIVRGTVPLALFGGAGYGARLGQLAAIRTVLGAGAPFLFAVAAEGLGMAATLVGAFGIGVAAVVPLLVLQARLRSGG